MKHLILLTVAALGLCFLMGRKDFLTICRELEGR